jgi:hypothetical protein
VFRIDFQEAGFAGLLFCGAGTLFQFIAGPGPQVYISCMVSHRQPVEFARNAGASLPLRRIVLADHVRLPWRFFGRLTAAIQTGL